ncbi:hypothetical protein ACJX0J_021123, partial [Zea mays]
YLIPIFSLQFWCLATTELFILPFVIKLSFIFYMFFFFSKMAFRVSQSVFLHSINAMGEHTPEEAFGLCMLMLLIISLLIILHIILSLLLFLLMQQFLLASSIIPSFLYGHCTHIGLHTNYGIFFYATTFYRISLGYDYNLPGNCCDMAAMGPLYAA